jgi:hypothetical protein
MPVTSTELNNVRGLNSRVAGDSSLLGCYVVSLGKWFHCFEDSFSTFFLNYLTMKAKVLKASEHQEAFTQ